VAGRSLEFGFARLVSLARCDIWLLYVVQGRKVQDGQVHVTGVKTYDQMSLVELA